MARDHYQKIQGLYNSIAVDYSKAIIPKRWAKEYDKFIKLLVLPEKILDLGCAAGRDSEILSRDGFKVVGVDFSIKLLEIARKQFPNIDFRLADIRSLPFEKDTFDAIYANAVFHHLKKEDMEKSLLEWSRVLKKNGIFYLSTKTGEGLKKTRDFLSEKERSFTLLSLYDLKKMLKKTGFKIIELYIKKSTSKRIDWNVAYCKKT